MLTKSRYLEFRITSIRTRRRLEAVNLNINQQLQITVTEVI